MAKTKPQTRTHTPKPIPAMLEGAFSTVIENRVAELNNQLAREGRLTNDPLAVSLRNLRIALKEQGFSFERIPVGAAPVAAAPAAPAPAKARQAPAKTKTTPPAAGPTKKVRTIKEEQIEALQVPGSVSETAPYGTDADGRPLAPYGVKQDGTPMKRRGRRKETPAAAPAKAAPSKPAAQAVASEETEEEETEEASEDEDEVAAAVAALTSDEEETEEASEENGSEDLSSEDLDGLLDSLDI